MIITVNTKQPNLGWWSISDLRQNSDDDHVYDAYNDDDKKYKIANNQIKKSIHSIILKN